VPGGFLYRTMIWGDETSPPSVMMTFVPVTKPEK
jgi:hypothetical protein